MKFSKRTKIVLSVSSGLLLAFSAVAAASSQSIAVEERPFDPAGDIFGALGAQSTGCDDELKGRYDDHVAIRCARSPETFKQIRSIWKEQAGGGLSEVEWDRTPWRKGVGNERAMFAFYRSAPLLVTFDDSSGTVAVAWLTRYPGCHESRAVMRSMQTEGTIGMAIKSRRPVYPEAARRERAGGVVAGSLLVDASGRLLDVCVAAASPRTLGFGVSVQAAYERSDVWPITHTGEPTMVVSMFLTRFSIPPDEARWSQVAREFFEDARVIDRPTTRARPDSADTRNP